MQERYSDLLTAPETPQQWPFAQFGVAVCERAINRDFVHRALGVLDRDRRRCPETPLIALQLPRLPGVDIYLKDEAAHPTGSLKHRLARSLFTAGIVAGVIREGTPLVEASSGSTAVSEAYLARLLDLPFHAVMPEGTSLAKVRAITLHGGKCHFVAPGAIYETAAMIAGKLRGVYLDQFTNATPATDWRCDNIASAILAQMTGERHPLPKWFVVGAGTGGTAATIGRHLRAQHVATGLCVADVENSAFFPAYRDSNPAAVSSGASRIEGVGRPRVEPSFLPGTVDRMLKVPDAVSIAGMRVLGELLDRPVGPSTGLNFASAALLGLEMMQDRQEGAIVTLICDSGERYADRHHNLEWLVTHDLDRAVSKAEQLLRMALAT